MSTADGTPRASVVVPARGRADLLRRCLEALGAQRLARGDFEVLVCDDGSEPPLRGRADPRSGARIGGGATLRWLAQPPLGPAAARNLGVREARAPIVVFVDSDVVVEPGFLEALVGALEARAQWLGAEARLEPCGARGPLREAPSSASGGRYHTAAIAYRREVLLAVGGFDEWFELPACEDVELALRVLARGPIGFVAAARARHPTRAVSAADRWRARRRWRYLAALAVRDGILAFPDRPAGRRPRLRLARAAVLGLPAGRALGALGHLRESPGEALHALGYAALDVVAGLAALPVILGAPVPERRAYLGPPGPPPPAPRVAVVVCAHRPYATLDRCLAGCATLDGVDEVIFVDNGSGGGLARRVRARHPGARVLELAENRLYCGGYNAGLRDALRRGADFVLLLNADTEIVRRDFVARLLEVARRRPRAAFLGPLVYLRTPGEVQRTALRFPRLARQILVWLPARLARRAPRRAPGPERETDFLNGVCVLCRGAALAEVGLLDESFGAYVEDAEWAWRARRRGWSSVYRPVPAIVHHEERRGYEHHAPKTFLLKRNTVLWYRRTGRRASAWAYAAAALALAWVRAAAAGGADRAALVAFARRLGATYAALLGRSPARGRGLAGRLPPDPGRRPS